MKHSAQAVYENGVLRPTTQLSLQEGQEVLVTVEALESVAPEEQARRRNERERQFAAEGMLETEPIPIQGPPPKDFQPIRLEGEPLSETVRKMRRGE